MIHEKDCDCDKCHLGKPDPECNCMDCSSYFSEKAESEAVDRCIEEEREARLDQ